MSSAGQLAQAKRPLPMARDFAVVCIEATFHKMVLMHRVGLSRDLEGGPWEQATRYCRRRRFPW
jgi:hypothetical protein